MFIESFFPIPKTLLDECGFRIGYLKPVLSNLVLSCRPGNDQEIRLRRQNRVVSDIWLGTFKITVFLHPYVPRYSQKIIGGKYDTTIYLFVVNSNLQNHFRANSID